MTNQTSKDLLRQSPLLTGLSEDELEQMVQASTVVHLPAGSVLIHEGDIGHSMYIVLSGELEVSKHSESEDVVLSRLGASEIVGEMALLGNTLRLASVRAMRDSSVLEVSKQAFEDLVYANPATLLAVLRTVIARSRSMEAMVQQNVKMAELGKLAAGLAHELNNPAAAAKRSTDQLKDCLATWLSLAAQLDESQLNEQQMTLRNSLRLEMGTRETVASDIDAVTRSDLESDIQAWLENGGVDQAWDIAPVLVTYRWTVAELQAAGRVFSNPQLAVFMRWLSAGYSVHELLKEVSISAERISAIG